MKKNCPDLERPEENLVSRIKKKARGFFFVCCSECPRWFHTESRRRVWRYLYDVTRMHILRCFLSEGVGKSWKIHERPEKALWLGQLDNSDSGEYTCIHSDLCQCRSGRASFVSFANYPALNSPEHSLISGFSSCSLTLDPCSVRDSFPTDHSENTRIVRIPRKTAKYLFFSGCKSLKPIVESQSNI